MWLATACAWRQRLCLDISLLTKTPDGRLRVPLTLMEWLELELQDHPHVSLIQADDGFAQATLLQQRWLTALYHWELDSAWQHMTLMHDFTRRSHTTLIWGADGVLNIHWIPSWLNTLSIVSWSQSWIHSINPLCVPTKFVSLSQLVYLF